MQRVPVCEQPCKSPGSTCTMRCLARAVYNWGHSNRTCSTVWGSPPHSHLTISSVIDLSNGVPSCGVSPLGKWYPRSRAALVTRVTACHFRSESSRRCPLETACHWYWPLYWNTSGPLRFATSIEHFQRISIVINSIRF